MATPPADAEDRPKVEEGHKEELATDTTDEISTLLDEVESAAQSNLRNSRTRSFQESLRHQIDSLRSRLNRRRSNSSSSGKQVASRLDVVSSAVTNRAPVAVIEARRPHLSPSSASIFRVETSSRSTGKPTAKTSTPDDPDTPMPAEERISESQRQRRSSVLFASRTQASRLLVDGGSSRVLLASGGHGATTSRRDLLGSTCLGQEVSLHDFDLNRRFNASPIVDSSTDSSEISENDVLEDDVKDIGAEYEPEAEKGTVLYSWGRGLTTLHDDGIDRNCAAQVDTKLKSKALLSISTSQYHSACATSTGSVYVVGQNVDGCVDPSIRDGAVVSRPVLLESLNHIRVIQVSCGYDHTAVVSSNGSVLSWGNNNYGQLGHRICVTDGIDPYTFVGPTLCRPAGMSLGRGRKANSISCGTNFTLVLTQHMSLLCCGTTSIAGARKASNWGQPAEIPSLMGLPLSAISAGDTHAGAVTAHGTAFLWGDNAQGQCAREFPQSLSVPLPLILEPGNDIVSVACGQEHTVFLTGEGSLLSCGNNARGQLGVAAAETTQTCKVVEVSHPLGEITFTSIDAGHLHTMAVDSVGDLWITDSECLRRSLKDKHVVAIAAGGNGSCIAISSSPRGPDKLALQRQFSVEMADDTNSLALDILNIIDGDQAKGHEIANKLEELLEYPSLLNVLKNPQQIDALYSRIEIAAADADARQLIIKSIERGMKNGLARLKGSRLIHPESVRCLLSYILFFDISKDEATSFDTKGQIIFAFCETLLSLQFEGYRALQNYATNYPRPLFVSHLVSPLLVALTKCLTSSRDNNDVEHFQPSRQAVPVIISALAWFYQMSVEHPELAAPVDFYSDAVSEIKIECLFEDLVRMKKASNHDRPRHFFLTAHPFLLSPGCKRRLLQVESQMNMFLTMMEGVDMSSITPSISIDVEPFYDIKVNREHILDDTWDQIKDVESKELRKRLRVQFDGEDGIDAGGVTKEYFQLLSSELFDLSSGLWSDKCEDVNWFNSDNDWDLKRYEFVGVLFGLAIYNSVLLDVHFPIAVYRKILGLPLGLEDLPDEGLRKGFKQLLDYDGDDVEDLFCLSFEIMWMELGEERRLELKENGSNIPVTSHNKEEYVLRYTRWILVDSIDKQWQRFQAGFMRVVEDSSLDLFLPEELELLVVGSPELDFKALECNAKYEGYDVDSPVIINFWKWVEESSNETKVKLLKFITASSKAPIGGLGKIDFIVQRAGPDSDKLPTSHTCFNTLLLPDYGVKYDKLGALLGRAVIECEGFGLQ